MNALILLRHSLTEANDRRLYCGWTDLPLSGKGRSLADEVAKERPQPACERYITSGLRRAEETLSRLTCRASDLRLADLREMNFGRFEMHSYEQLRADEDYLRWIEDETGTVACPGGESSAQFKARVLRGGETLLHMEAGSALVVCHGGVIVNLMQAGFPGIDKNFYEWQPGACRGYRVLIENSAPQKYESL